jgi:formate dehydrogenase major subunit
VILGTHNVASIGQLLNPQLLAPGVLATATYRDVAEAEAILLVNSQLAEEHFVVDLIAKRAIRNGGRLVAIGPHANRTAMFADVFLECPTEAETTVLQAVAAECLRQAGQDPSLRGDLVGKVASLTPAQIEAEAGVPYDAILEAASILGASRRKVLIFNRDYRGARRRHDAELMAAIAPVLGCTLLPLHERANAQGLLDMGGHPAWYPGYRATADEASIREFEGQWGAALRGLDTGDVDLGRLLASGSIKAAVVFGEDPLGLEGLPADMRTAFESLECLVVSDMFLTKTAEAAAVVLPMSSTVETSGTFTNSERRVQQVRQAIPPQAGRETWQIIVALAAKMGFRFDTQYASPADVFDEIRRVAPIYGAVTVDAEDASGVWDASRTPLQTAGPDGAAMAPAVTPVRTAGLDCLDARFEKWFSGLFAT